MSIKNIAILLEENGIINNHYIFMILAKGFQLYSNKTLRAGEYQFHVGSTQLDVLQQIINGGVVMHKITVPEGYTVWQIMSYLSSIDGVKKSSDLETIEEGSLFPGTYFYTYGTEDKVLLHKMSSQMNLILDHAWGISNFSVKNTLQNKRNVLILASIIEKEVIFDFERPLVARVYLNRIEKKMPLQADPTVIYGITNGKKSFDRKVTFNDLKHKSLYNTYRNLGLPPTPICNPSKASILAVMNPAESNALYFVADGSGMHIFSDTFEEHKANIKKIRQQKVQK